MKKVNPKTKAAKLSLRPLVLAALVGFAVIVALFISFSRKEETPLMHGVKASPGQSLVTPKRQDRQNFSGHALIQSVGLQPALPTRLDTIHAEVILASDAPAEQMQYLYIWKVNEQVIKNTAGNALDLSPFKKRDLIYVTVTPYKGSVPGSAVRSPVVAIQGVPPSLELKIIGKTAKIGEAYTLQLFSSHPDSETAVFNLEEPRINGMTIDGQTGKISWIIQPDQQGTVRFGAAIVDSDGNRVTKVFEINLN